MKLLQRLLFSVVTALWTLTISAARLYTDAELSSNMINSLCQDQQGYIWIGTEYGLNKFDGVHFTQYFHEDGNPHSLSDDIIRLLVTDRNGVLWVISNNGVQRYNRTTDSFESVLFYNNSPAANINDIQVTTDGKIWLLSAHDGIFEVNTDEMTASPVERINRMIQKKDEGDNMYIDSKNRLWLGYRMSGLQMIDLKTAKSRYYDEQQLNARRPCDIIEDPQHRLTITTYSEVMQLNERTMQFESVISYPRSSILYIYKTPKQQYFIGTMGNGLWQVDFARQKVSTVNIQQEERTEQEATKVRAFLEDRNGNRWIGWYQKGLMFVPSRTDAFHFLGLRQMETDNGNNLRAVFADKNRHVYICQEQGGITSINHEGKTLSHWMGTHTVMTMYDDQRGSFWAGTFRNGLFRIDPQTGKETWISSTGTQRIGGITQDKQGNIYTASFNDGLHSYTPDGMTERVLGKGQLSLTNKYLNTLFTDKDGRIWIGHYYGIDVYDPKTDQLADVPVDSLLRPAIVYAIRQSPDGSIWIGSNKGLFQYNKDGQWKRFTSKDGLPNDIVCGLVIIPDGTIWISTFRGLAQMSPDGTFTPYYRGNGLKEWSYMRGVYAHSAIGEVVMGHIDGITYFTPKDIVKDQFEQGITLTGMRLANTDVNGAMLSGGEHIINKPLETTTDITISYEDNTFSLRFSSMDFRDAQNVHYEYRFSDEPKEVWHQTVSGVSEIFFTHLAVGTHHLQVRAYDNGVYSPVKELTIHVTPPWYRSWMAYLFYLLLLATFAVLGWRYYWNKRQAETNEEKIKFFVDISHELRSPLTLIKSPLDKLLRSGHDAETTRALRNMENNTNRLLNLVNQILSIRKIEKGQMRLHYAETPLADFVENICHDYDYLVEKRNITMTFTNETGDMKAWIDCDNFDKVVANLINNAIKYVQDNGHVDVILSKTDNQQALLTVRDDGPGIDEAQLKKIFDRFYQTSARPVTGQMNYGIGLNLAQKLAMLHGGSITARNRSDQKGSEFIVTLPLGNRHLQKSQLVDEHYFDKLESIEAKTLLTTDENSPRKAVRRKTTYRVAVVDDDQEIRNFLKTELGESYHVTTYPDGNKALEGIIDEVPDLVISDVVMPEMDGIELLKRLKGNTQTSHIPVILLTTKTEHAARIEGLTEGADAYVDKPFNLEELETRIAGLIANRIKVRSKFTGLQGQEDTVRKIELKGNDAELMERIMKAVNENLDDSDFNVEALADTVGLSRVQLHRRMKELTGITVGEFIRNLRLQQAAKLFESGDVNVSQVTYAVGFSNPNNFTAAFKRHFGVTPTAYIAKHQGKKDVMKQNQ
ncbi:MAG: response regulator [Prevotella sp.]|nr:response regulator [Prevotella sp.]